MEGDFLFVASCVWPISGSANWAKKKKNISAEGPYGLKGAIQRRPNPSVRETERC